MGNVGLSWVLKNRAMKVVNATGVEKRASRPYCVRARPDKEKSP